MSHENCSCGENHDNEKGGCCKENTKSKNEGGCCKENHDNCHHEHDGEEFEKVTISLDGEEDITCNVLGVFDVNDRDYIALLPEKDEEVLIFRYTEEDGNVSLDNIETDEEYEEVSEVFYEIFIDEDEEYFEDEELDDDSN